MTTLQIIVNPVAGKGAGLAQTEPIRRLLQANHLSNTDGGLMAHADGEIFLQDGKHLEMELLPRKLQVICLPGGASHG